MTRALLVQHTVSEDAGLFGDWLPAAGLRLHSVRPYAGDPLPASLDGYGALIVLGGPMSAYDDEAAPWLPAVVELMRSGVRTGIPTLGICLGAQLLGRASGGEVRRGPFGPELGLCRMRLAPDAATDPLLGGVDPEQLVVQWHWDEVSVLPPGAVALAASPAYPHQAFRLGERAWGLQFHPEATAELVAVWAEHDGTSLREAGRRPAEVVAAVAAEARHLVAVWRPVAERFAALATVGSR